MECDDVVGGAGDVAEEPLLVCGVGDAVEVVGVAGEVARQGWIDAGEVCGGFVGRLGGETPAEECRAVARCGVAGLRRAVRVGDEGVGVVLCLDCAHEDLHEEASERTDYVG